MQYLKYFSEVLKWAKTENKPTSSTMLPQKDEHVQFASAHQHILLNLIAIVHLKMHLAVRRHHTATHITQSNPLLKSASYERFDLSNINKKTVLMLITQAVNFKPLSTTASNDDYWYYLFSQYHNSIQQMPTLVICNLCKYSLTK